MVYLEAVIQGFSLKKLFYFIYTLGIPVVGSISSRAAGTMSAVLVEVGSFVGISQVCYLFIVYTVVFWGNCPYWLVHHFKYTFHFNLFLPNIWYCISFLLSISSALVIYRAFVHKWLIYWRNAFINLQL